MTSEARCALHAAVDHLPFASRGTHPLCVAQLVADAKQRMAEFEAKTAKRVAEMRESFQKQALAAVENAKRQAAAAATPASASPSGPVPSDVAAALYEAARKHRAESVAEVKQLLNAVFNFANKLFPKEGSVGAADVRTGLQRVLREVVSKYQQRQAQAQAQADAAEQARSEAAAAEAEAAAAAAAQAEAEAAATEAAAAEAAAQADAAAQAEAAEAAAAEAEAEAEAAAVATAEVDTSEGLGGVEGLVCLQATGIGGSSAF